MKATIFSEHNNAPTGAKKAVVRRTKIKSEERQFKAALQIRLVEPKIAKLLNAAAALAVKSADSARFLLVKHLLNKGENIVTLNSISLLKNEPIREQLGIEVRYAEGNTAILKSLVDENTRLIFLEAISPETRVVPDFQKIITFAKTMFIPVLLDNTGGFLSRPFNCNAWEWQYSIERLDQVIPLNSDWKALIVEIENDKLSEGLGRKVKAKGSVLSAQNLFGDIGALPEKAKLLSETSFSLAKRLKDITFVNDVEYLGFPSHRSHFNGLRYFSGGFGSLISLTLDGNAAFFDFFLDCFIPKSFELFQIVEINYEKKRITLNLIDSELEKHVLHFQNAFLSVEKHFESNV